MSEITKNTEITLSKEESKALKFAEIKVIDSPEQMSEGVSILSVLNQTLDRLTKHKEERTKPINATLKLIRSDYKPYEDKLETAIAALRRLMINYQTEQKCLAKIEEDKIINDKRTKVETKIAKMEEVAKPEAKVVADEGMVKFKTVPCFEVEDVSKLPKEYILPNETMIRDAMKGGKELPGVRYFTEERPVNFR